MSLTSRFIRIKFYQRKKLIRTVERASIVAAVDLVEGLGFDVRGRYVAALYLTYMTGDDYLIEQFTIDRLPP